MPTFRAVLAAVVLLVSSMAWAPSVAAGPRGGIAPPDEPGPWAVGLTTTTMVDPARGGRTLPVDVWYPVDDEDAGSGDVAELDLLFTTLALDGVIADPDPSSDGPFPLVVFSHGSGGVRYQSWFLLQALASHGFVVVAPDHVGNTAPDALFGTTAPFATVARDRPRDVSLVIDRMVEQNADRTDPLAPLIDPDRVAVAGHSFGGFTALATAGGFGSYEPDPRIDAIVPLAAAAPLSDAELAAIDVPMMLISGTADATVPVERSAERIWSLVSAPQSHRVDIIDAGHNSFTNACDLADAFAGAGVPPALLALLTASADEACAPELIPIDDAHRIIEIYTVSFLQRTIGEEGAHQRYLTPSYPRRAGLAVDHEHAPGRAPART